jgi:hypothetical protein
MSLLGFVVLITLLVTGIILDRWDIYQLRQQLKALKEKHEKAI